jgi:hypothetical protein
MTDRSTLERIRAEQLTAEIGGRRNGDSSELRARAVTVRLADIEPEDVCWLWPARIPFGKVTVIEGDPGLGKSTLSLDLAARLSTGQPTPDGHPLVRATSIIMTAEDGLADTIRPRLEAAGADCAETIAITGVESNGQTGSLMLPLHIAAVRDAIHEHAAMLVIIDPLVAFLGSEVNSWRDHDVRRALRPLADLAESTGAAIIVIRHLTKGTGPAIYRGGGSIGIAGAARSVLLVARDPDDQERRILAVTKTNLAAEAPSLAFGVGDDGHGRSRINWLGTSHHTANALVATPEEPEVKSAVEEAMDLIEEVLADGPRPVKEVEKAADEADIAPATLRRARQRMGARSKPDGFGGPRIMHLPSPSDAQYGRGITSGAHSPQVSKTDKTEVVTDDSE